MKHRVRLILRSLAHMFGSLVGGARRNRLASDSAVAQAGVNLTSGVPSNVSGLIFDLGLHQGYDSRFYLSKSFRVVGLEAVPALCASAGKRLAHFGDRITIVNKALASKPGERVTFFSVPDKDDWGSLVQGNAGKGIYETVAFEVDTIDLTTMFDLYGVPHYIKCDLEGADRTFVAQLANEPRRPTFVSVEINHEDDIDLLERCGYEVGQIVNQAMNIHVAAPNPAREGVYVNAHFDGETSGLFGRELPPEKWRPLAEVRQMYIDWRALKERDDNLAPGWLDVHVCKRAALQ